MFSNKCIILIIALIWCIAEIRTSKPSVKRTQSTKNVPEEFDVSQSIDAVETLFDISKYNIVTFEARNIIEDRIRTEIEKFRNLMGDEIVELGIPRLEPLVTKHLDFDVNHPIGIFNGTVDNVKVNGLQSFNMTSLVYKLPYKININMSFSLAIEGESYDIEGIMGDLFNIYGHGPFNLSMTNLNILTNFQLGYKNLEFYMKNIELNVALEEMKCDFQNLMGGGENGALFNKIIGQIAPEAVDTLWPEMKTTVTEKVKDVATEILKKLDLSNIFP